MNHQVGIRSSYMLGIHDHSSPAQGGAVPQVSITGHIKAVHDALLINADQVDGVEENAIVTAARVNAFITKVAIDALNVDADTVDGEEAAAIVTAARVDPLVTKVKIDALGINADQVDAEHAAAIVTEARVGAVLTKAQVDALAINADKVDGEEAAAIVTAARVDPLVTKVKIDALGINADQVDGEHAAAIVTAARVDPLVTKVKIDALAVNAGQVDGVDLPGTPANVLAPRDVAEGSIASNDIQNENDPPKNTNLLVYTKLKEMKVNEVTGAMRAYFEMKSQTGVQVRGRVYKNGGAVGAEHSTNELAYQPYFDDIGACAVNDLIQIYAYCVAAGTVVVTLQKMKYQRGITEIGGVALNTVLGTGAAAYSMTNQDPV